MPTRRAHKPPAPPLNRFELYELCVQQPALSARFLHALHPGRAVTLREDFSGAAAIAREWVKREPSARAVAVDHDPDALMHASSHPRLRLVCADAARTRERADVIAGFNFACGELPTRADLLRYLRNARRTLNPRGVIVLDLYGGPTAHTTGTTMRRLRGPGGERIEYRWQQREVRPFSSRVGNAIHFRVAPPSGRPGPSRTLRNAFTYDWRLWSVAELREAMADAGFATTEVHDRLGGAVSGGGTLHPVAAMDDDNHPDDFVVYVVGRT
ncbi:MAG: hypothetical protein ACT4PL_09630 [Phycisphaerales bacterium]